MHLKARPCHLQLLRQDVRPWRRKLSEAHSASDLEGIAGNPLRVERLAVGPFGHHYRTMPREQRREAALQIHIVDGDTSKLAL